MRVILSGSYIRAVPALLQTKNPLHPLVRWAKDNDVKSINRLAALLGISGPRLSQILTRKHRPSTELALQINRTTKIPLEALLEMTPAELNAKPPVIAGWRTKRPKRRKPGRAK